ncbi:MAG: 50S ribosomal protein L21 [Coriobacteriales bacterium]
MYAIIKTGGKQYTVKPGDVIDVEKIEGEAGTQVQLPVLFLNNGSDVVTDADALAQTTVTAEIVDQHKGPKAIIFKFKKRKGYKKLRGHRQNLTKIVITEVAGVKAEPKAAKPAKAEAPAEPVAAAEPAAPAALPSAEELNKMTVAQLKEIAAERGIKLSSSARKAEIIETIQNA